MVQRGSQGLFRADRGCPSFASRDRRYADVRRTLAQLSPQSCRWGLLLLLTDLVGAEKHGAVSGSAISCHLHASSPSAAMVDPSDARRGTFRNGLGNAAGRARASLFDL